MFLEKLLPRHPPVFADWFRIMFPDPYGWYINKIYFTIHFASVCNFLHTDIIYFLQKGMRLVQRILEQPLLCPWWVTYLDLEIDMERIYCLILNVEIVYMLISTACLTE